MKEHYPAATVSVTRWCATCKKTTPHRVDDHRVSSCIPCTEREATPARSQQANLQISNSGCECMAGRR